MKNREQYPNTDDALKAFEEHNKHCACGCSFEEWLDYEDSSKLNMTMAGILLGSLFGEIIGAKDKPADKENKKPSNDDELTDVECPICHGKNAKIDRFLSHSITCPDCGSFIGIAGSLAEKKPNLRFDTKAFKSFIADLCTKNNAKA